MKGEDYIFFRLPISSFLSWCRRHGVVSRGNGHHGPAAGRGARDHRGAAEGGDKGMGADGGQTGDGHQHCLCLQTPQAHGPPADGQL